MQSFFAIFSFFSFLSSLSSNLPNQSRTILLETGMESTKKTGGNEGSKGDAPHTPEKPRPPRKSGSSKAASININYEVLRYDSISDAILSQCATLFGEHYGVWGAKGCKPGEHVKLGPQRLKT